MATGGLRLIEVELDLEHDVHGVLQVCHDRTDGVLYLRPGLTAEEADRLLRWTERRLELLRELGPEADGWGVHGECLQLIARNVILPDVE